MKIRIESRPKISEAFIFLFKERINALKLPAFPSLLTTSYSLLLTSYLLPVFNGCTCLINLSLQGIFRVKNFNKFELSSQIQPTTITNEGIK